MRLVITGGAGFIGSHLVDRLLAEGHQVVVLDNLLTGCLDNLAPHLGDPACEFIHHDVSQYVHVQGEVDWVLHLASPASPVDYLRWPLETLKVGSLGTMNGLGLARAKAARFLLASTSEVYGDPQEHPQTEAYWGHVNPVGPRSVYDEAKRFAEAATMGYHRTHGLDTRIIRIFNTYGPRNRVQDGRVVPTFINQALRHQPLTVFGDGSQTRSFQYVADLVEGILRVMAAGEAEPMNLGNPREFTVLELARKVVEQTHSKSEIQFRPLPQDDPRLRCPDITRARQRLSWEPSVLLDEGLERTIAWYRSLMEAVRA